MYRPGDLSTISPDVTIAVSTSPNKARPAVGDA